MTVAAAWRLDVKSAEVRQALDTAGVPNVLLKGRGLVALLYDDGSPRAYNDCDLLVPPDERERAHQVLAGLGFTPWYGLAPLDLPHDVEATRELHAVEWRRAADAMSVDLHYTFSEVGASPAAVWAAVEGRTVVLEVGGSPARVPDPPTAALLCALHVAQHGPLSHRPLEDLSRAIRRLDVRCWQDAAALAATLGATPALGTGLRLAPGGAALAECLGVPWQPSRRMLLHWERAPWGAAVWDSLLHTSGVRARAALLADLLVPSPEALRLGSRVARRGRAGLIAAYIVRDVRLMGRVLPAIGAWGHHVHRHRRWARSGDLVHDEPGRGVVAMQRDADERLDRR